MVEPDQRLRGRYDDLAGSFSELYPATRDTMHRLARLDESGRGDAVAEQPLPGAGTAVRGRPRDAV